jgi:hypothetical protein
MADQNDIHEIDEAIAALEFAAADRGLYLTVLAMKRTRDMLKWESAEHRKKSLEAPKRVGVKK